MQDLTQRVKTLLESYHSIRKSINLTEMELNLVKLEAKTTDPDLWKDQENARRVMKEFNDTKEEIEEVKSLDQDIEAINLFLSDGSVGEDIKEELLKLEKKLEKFKLTSFLSGKYDKKNAIVSIHAGQGGTEAMDWASMLYRMYLRYVEKRGWSSETIDMSEGEEAGVKSVTFKVQGTYAYGYLKGEAGTHRLVRQSPFNADNLRQTSFALVEVLPELEDLDLPDIEIKEADLEWQFFRASSQGGQNVQKVSTAVRVKHIPTGISVTAQTERFQEQNRKIALSLLRSKLWLLQEAKEAAEKKDIKGEYRPASWGNQIRSYVLHPYKMVKDLRTEVETGNPDAVLDGELDPFIEAEIQKL
jgi:peptide chain release factor 2